MSSINPIRFAVIGGGISGLTAAHRLRKLVPSAVVELFESSDHVGGVLATHREGDLLVERGADSFITKQPYAVDLCQELGIAGDLIPTNAANRRALVLRGDQLIGVPEGFVLIRPQRLRPILKSPLLSWRGKMRLMAERRCPVPPEIHNSDFDDNLAHFATARLGQEAFERLVEPLVAGIYTADAEKLSVAATMPEAIDVLRKHGTLWHRTDRTAETASGARYGHFVTPRRGVGQLVETLAERLGNDAIHLNASVENVSQKPGGTWSLQLAGGETAGPFDGLVLAVPAIHASTLLATINPELASLLRTIEYASSAVVSLAFRKEQIGRDLDGFGFVVPRVEHRNIVAASFSSVKFADRAPSDVVLIRTFLGGALRPDLVNLSDAEIEKTAIDELTKILRITGGPQYVDVTRWQEKMPQYNVGHVQLVDRIEQQTEKHAGLALAGNGYRGVGIPYCVRSGDSAARRVAAKFLLE